MQRKFLKFLKFTTHLLKNLPQKTTRRKGTILGAALLVKIDSLEKSCGQDGQNRGAVKSPTKHAPVRWSDSNID
jgi:hypothetical protein